MKNASGEGFFVGEMGFLMRKKESGASEKLIVAKIKSIVAKIALIVAEIAVIVAQMEKRSL